jgi:hypothetical protein
MIGTARLHAHRPQPTGAGMLGLLQQRTPVGQLHCTPHLLCALRDVQGRTPCRRPTHHWQLNALCTTDMDMVHETHHTPDPLSEAMLTFAGLLNVSTPSPLDPSRPC